MSKSNGDTLTAYADHERTTAQRMKHWPIFLVREYRRLEGIARTVQAQAAAEALDSTSDGPPEITALVEEPAAVEASEPASDDDNLEHALKFGELDALAELEAMEAEARIEEETTDRDPNDAQSRPETSLDDVHDERRAESDTFSDKERLDDQTIDNEESKRARARLQTSLHRLPLSRKQDEAEIREEADLLSQLLQADPPAPGSADPNAD